MGEYPTKIGVRWLDAPDSSRVISDVLRNRIKAHRKHFDGGSMEMLSSTNAMWLPILVEEIGEIANCLTYDSGKTTENLYDEIIDVMTICWAWAQSFGPTTFDEV